MAIKIGGTSIIDDNKNIANVGILTIGTGGTAGRVQVGTGATIHGSGNVSIAGTIYALDIVTPLKVDTFDPSNGATNVLVNDDIRITFNSAIGIGTTGFVYINSPTSTIATYGVGSTYISRTDANKTLVITPNQPFAKGVVGAPNTISPVVSSGFIVGFPGINTTGAPTTYSFQTETVSLGSSYQGGYFICYGGGVQWIVSPRVAERSLNWYSRDTASTCAQTVSGCTGWFVPNGSQLGNPGYQCRTYWDSYSNTTYWSSDPGPLSGGYPAWAFNFVNGTTPIPPQLTLKPDTLCVRSFRCVTY